ncbi:MAG TPA: ABC transporter ATP-binding protein [Candidatus Kryptobacter bacterium]|nr:ABC transporter ATP-binding protein [Candidatus Kryptobacter bacterium]
MSAGHDGVVEFDAVTVRYDHVPALREATFSLEKGHIFGFLGPNGAGKTTTIYTMLGLLEPSEGRCHVATNQIGFVLDKPGLIDDLTLFENLEFFLKLRRARAEQLEARPVEKLIESVGLAGYEKRVVKTLSTGMKKRGELARALLLDSELLILDEPTSGLDPICQVEFRSLVRSLVASKRCAVFITSHNLAEIEAVCDEFAIIDGGEIKIQTTIESLHNSGKTLEQLYLEQVSV